MAELGCVILSAQNITDGSVTVTPTSPPATGVASVVVQSQVLNRMRASESPCPVVVVGNDLVITLNPTDREGGKLCWTSYE